MSKIGARQRAKPSRGDRLQTSQGDEIRRETFFYYPLQGHA
jgi:hypothetical protein